MLKDLKKEKFIMIGHYKFPFAHIYKILHNSSMYDRYLETIKNYFMKKYDFAVFAISSINTISKKMIYNSHTDNWSEYNWSSYEKGLELNFISSNRWQNMMEEFIYNVKDEENFIIKDRFTQDLSEALSFILGFNLNGRYSITLENPNKNIKTFFWFGFKGDIFFNNMNYNIYINLIKDFNDFIDILEVFLEYFSLYNTIDDSFLLENMLRNKNIKLNSFK
jgi:hypothetical protein